MDAGSWIAASTRRSPEHLGQTKIWIPNARCSNSAQEYRRRPARHLPPPCGTRSRARTPRSACCLWSAAAATFSTASATAAAAASCFAGPPPRAGSRRLRLPLPRDAAPPASADPTPAPRVTSPEVGNPSCGPGPPGTHAATLPPPRTLVQRVAAVCPGTWLFHERALPVNGSVVFRTASSKASGACARAAASSDFADFHTHSVRLGFEPGAR